MILQHFVWPKNDRGLCRFQLHRYPYNALLDRARVLPRDFIVALNFLQQRDWLEAGCTQRHGSLQCGRGFTACRVAAAETCGFALLNAGLELGETSPLLGLFDELAVHSLNVPSRG